MEHIRSTLEAVKRSGARTVALNTGPQSSIAAAGKRAEQYIGSLPTTRPGAQKVLIAVLIVLAAQVLSSLFGRLQGVYPTTTGVAAGQTTDLLQALTGLADINASNVVKATSALVHADVVGVAVVVSTACLASWLVLRPVANGLLRARALFDAEGDGSLHEREAALVATIDAGPVRRSSLDLLVPALFATASLLLAVSSARDYFDGVPSTSRDTFADAGPSVHVTFLQPRLMLVLSLVVAAGAAARLAQLERARRGRRSGSPAKRGRIGRNFTTAGWAALAASIPLTIAMLYGGLDTTPADVDLRFATPLRRVLSDGEITIKFSCSELCADDTFNLHGDGGPAPDPRFVESLTSSKYTEPWEGRRGSWTLKLTRPQRRWLRSRLHKGYPWLEIWVESRPGNFTKTRLNFPFS